ncbi:MAG TPA: hypothetical protein VHQ41_01920 [Patescibacteria group bacterium]|jgi:hypothetical protein|nr:hypothetical protein [Patescibacteria group bacterium]
MTTSNTKSNVLALIAKHFAWLLSNEAECQQLRVYTRIDHVSGKERYFVGMGNEKILRGIPGTEPAAKYFWHPDKPESLAGDYVSGIPVGVPIPASTLLMTDDLISAIFQSSKQHVKDVITGLRRARRDAARRAEQQELTDNEYSQVMADSSEFPPISEFEQKMTALGDDPATRTITCPNPDCQKEGVELSKEGKMQLHYASPAKTLSPDQPCVLSGQPYGELQALDENH